MSSNILFITIKEISIIHGWSYVWSHRHYHVIKDALGKTKPQKITRQEYCNYEGIQLEVLENFLKENTTRNKSNKLL